MRINGLASRLGLANGLSLDLTTSDLDDGRPWDFNGKGKHDNPLDTINVIRKQAMLLIGSPMVKSFFTIAEFEA